MNTNMQSSTVSITKNAEFEFSPLLQNSLVPSASIDTDEHFSDYYWKPIVSAFQKADEKKWSLGLRPKISTVNNVLKLGDISSLNDFSPKTAMSVAFASNQNSVLSDVLRDLSEVAVEAQEEGIQIPSDATLTNAHRLLLAMYRISPQRFEIYSTLDGEIAIDASNGFGCSVILLCDSEGGALCLVNVNGRHRRARYSDMTLLPDGFVQEALEELAQQNVLTK